MRVSARRLTQIGRLLGWVWYHCAPIRRKVATENVRLVFGEKVGQRDDMVKKSFTHMCINVLEMLKTVPLSQGRGPQIKIQGMEHYERAKARGNGVLVVTAHIGNFDLLAMSQAEAGIPLAIVSKRLHQPGVNSRWMAARRRSGVQIFEDGRQQKSILKWIRDGKVLGLVADQRLSEKYGGIPVPFFGRKVWTNPAVAKLHLRTGAPILPVMIFREETGAHCVCIEPALEITDKMDSRKPGGEFHVMYMVNQRVESWIRSFPEQWMWIHRRFKNSMESGS